MKCKHLYRAPDLVSKIWKCTNCHKEVKPFEGQELLGSACDHSSYRTKFTESKRFKNGKVKFKKDITCMDCGKGLPSNWGKRGVWAGDANTDKFWQLKFQCQNIECELIGDKVIFASFEEPPEIIPSHAQCPVCDSRMDYIPDLALNGVVVGTDNPCYTKTLADSEHRWMQLQIDETKKAIQGKTGVSPYSSAKINYDYWEKDGTAKRVTADEETKRRELLDERNKTLAEHTKDKIDEEHLRTYVGKRKE